MGRTRTPCPTPASTRCLWLAADYKEHHTDVSVKFVVKLAPEKMQEALAVGLHNKFKLTAKVSIGECRRPLLRQLGRSGE